jgi:polar amino acid transport system substrate-binding protein
LPKRFGARVRFPPDRAAFDVGSQEESLVLNSVLHLRRGLLVSLAGVAAVMTIAGCGGSSKSSSSSGSTPAGTASKVRAGAVAQGGTIRYCSDISSPPLEFYKNGTQATGSDIDLGNAIAATLGLHPVWVNTTFSGIIPAMQAGHCDAIISQLFDKPARRAVVDFVDYMNSSQSILVKAGNPNHITGISDLCGHKVAAETGTTITDYLATASKACTQAGKPGISVQTFLRDADALEQLGLGHVDAYGTTLETGAYDMSKAGTHTFQFAGAPFGQILTGIATRKNDPGLHAAIARAFATLKANGTYRQIFAKWGLTSDLLK